MRPKPLAGRAIVYAGALYRRKGVDVLLRAMPRVLREVPDAHLYLVGNRDNPEVEQLAHDLGLEAAVTFIGFHSDPREYMGSAEVFVLPSRAEGFGNVLTEARSMHVPIVASRVGGIPEALDGGGAGVLVEPEDEQRLAAAIVEILRDGSRAADLRRRAGADLDRFRVETAARAYLALYSHLVPRQSR
ncbi:glycosyltransferase family 4 protein [Amnibacterium kyonggiense]